MKLLAMRMRGAMPKRIIAPLIQTQTRVNQHVRRGLSTSGGALGKGFDILADDEGSSSQGQRMSIRAFGDHSFQINDVVVNQSVILLPKSFFLWNARTYEDITLESLAVFPILHPTIEVLFIGCGENVPGVLNPEITSFFKSKGIIVEAQNSVNAASTFNVLNSEGRNVACALLTILPVPERDENEAEANDENEEEAAEGKGGGGAKAAGAASASVPASTAPAKKDAASSSSVSGRKVDKK